MRGNLIKKITEKRSSIEKSAQEYFKNTRGESLVKDNLEQGNAPGYDSLMRFVKEITYAEFEKIEKRRR